jgi:hypothetical protein
MPTFTCDELEHWFNAAHINRLRSFIQGALDSHSSRRKLGWPFLVTELVDFLRRRIIQDKAIPAGASFHAVRSRIYLRLLHDLRVRALHRTLAVSDHPDKCLDRRRSFHRGLFRFWRRRRALKSKRTNCQHCSRDHHGYLSNFLQGILLSAGDHGRHAVLRTAHMSPPDQCYPC